MSLINDKSIFWGGAKVSQSLARLLKEYKEILQLFESQNLSADYVDGRSFFSLNNQNLIESTNSQELITKYVRVKKNLSDLYQENQIMKSELKSLDEAFKSLSSKFRELEKSNEGYSNKLKKYEALVPDLAHVGEMQIIKIEDIGNQKILTSVFEPEAYGYFFHKNTLMFVQDSLGLGLTWIGPDGKECCFYPAQVKKLESQRESFINFSRTEWGLLIKAISSCISLMEKSPSFINFPESFDKFSWTENFAALNEQFRCLPSMFRYDQVILVDEVANPDYEALHLRFINVGFNNFQQNTFDVRVGASLVGKQGFSQFPKIEFPLLENGEKPFNSWYEESQDDSGPKFEIRFALTNRSFDLKVWDSLSNEDKSMLTVFLIYLPNHLKRVRREIQLDKRSWDEWDQFAVETSNVFKDFLSNQSAFAKGMLENEFGSKLKNKDKVEEIKKYGVASKKRSRKNIK